MSIKMAANCKPIIYSDAIIRWQSPLTLYCSLPYYILYHVVFVSVVLLESNAELEKTLETTAMPTYKYYTIKTTDQLYGKICMCSLLYTIVPD
jgi:hypothetical protein